MYKLQSMDEEETLALVNQAFAKAMNVYDPAKGKFTTYFMISAKGHILRHFRDWENTIRSSREDFTMNKVIYCDSLDKVIYKGDSEDICLEDVFGIEDDETQSFVNEAIHKLSKTDRQIFTLYHIGGLSQRKIGKIFGTTQKQISRSVARSKASLKLILKEVS